MRFSIVSALTLCASIFFSFPLCAEARDLPDSISARRAELLSKIASREGDGQCNSGAGVSGCVASSLSKAIAELYLRSSTDSAALDRRVMSALRTVAESGPPPGVVKGKAKVHTSTDDVCAAGAEGEDNCDDNVVADARDLEFSAIRRELFHWHAAALYRLVRLSDASDRKLGEQTRRAIAEAFADYAGKFCDKRFTTDANAWVVYGSENHDAMRDGACWAAADLLKRDPAFASHRFPDGTTPVEQAQLWTAFVQHYLRARATRGMFIEYFSPTYSKYTLASFYLYADYADDAGLARGARNMLDLWWAQWALEQVNGTHGGSKARVYPDMIGGGTPMDTVAWLYFGFGSSKKGLAPHYIGPFTSRYTPNPLVAALALDLQGRGAYELRARTQGRLIAQPKVAKGTKPDPMSRRTLADDGPGLVRITYATSDFVMGTAMTERRAVADWVGSSAQNRWNGVVMASHPEARVVAFPDGAKVYNAVWGVQSKSTQLLQRVAKPLGKGSKSMRVLFGGPLKRVEADGWVFVEDSAWVAVRPASGAYRFEGNWMFPSDPNAVIVIQAAEKKHYADLAAFQKAMRGTSLKVTPELVEFTGLGGARRIGLPGGSAPGVARIDGKAVDYAPNFAFESPYLNAAWGGSTVTLSGKDGQKAELDFGR